MAYAAITIEGGLLPADLIDQIATGTAAGQRDADFGLSPGVRLTDEIQLAFSEIRKHWDSFQARLARSTASPTTLTREAWIIPFFETLGVTLEYQRSGQLVGSDTFVISHLAGTGPDAPPVHIVAAGQSLDRPAEGSRRSPHATVQEFLNRTDAVWGIVTNGEHLRLLRDAQALARPAYIDFDLKAMVEGNLYSEFVVLYRLLQATHWTVPATEAGSWLETYYQEGLAVGGRVREHLRDGVEEALRRLGTAFLAHPQSDVLRAALQSGTLATGDYYRELLRLIYRFLFLLVVEERKLLLAHDSGGSAEEALAHQAIYTRFYSMARLRDRCEKRFEDDGFSDLWEGLKQTFLLFREQERADALGLDALNGELFGSAACEQLEGASCTNVDLLTAIFHISTFRDGKLRRRVNYAALDVEELGSVYESLLDYHPLVEFEPAPRFDLITGSERKQTGSYYTPPSLVAELIKSALVPVVRDRLAAAETWEQKEKALLDLRVVDPASGSGHFLLAAARTIARELARVRTEGNEPSPESYRKALRDVVRNCIYAVDKNPLAVDLCKVALWIEGFNAGRPLSFLDHHIKHGDALIGVFDLDVLAEGIPDEAYNPVTGDQKAIASATKKRNKQERIGQIGLFATPRLPDPAELAEAFRRLGLAEERTPYEVHAKDEAYHKLRGQGTDWWRDKVACDLWTAAFFWPLLPGSNPPTTDTIRRYLQQDNAADGRQVGEAVALSQAHPFFHWPLEFPDVFANGGFDVVLGNPPWERIKLQEEEFFAGRDVEIARAPNKAARDRLIKTLPERAPALARDFDEAKHLAEAGSKFIRTSVRFPLCGRGDVNTYSVFAELNRVLIGPIGRAGCIVPSGIATDDTTKLFFQSLMENQSLVSLFSFENEDFIFPGVHNQMKFCLLTLCSSDADQNSADFAFFIRRVEQLHDDWRHFTLSAPDVALVNPNTHTCPVFRSRRDAELTKAIYLRVPVLVKEGPPEENPWGVRFLRMFDMSNDSRLFRTRQQLERDGWALDGNRFLKDDSRYVPLYEAKMVNQYDHRYASLLGVGNGGSRPSRKFVGWYGADVSNPHDLVVPRYWVPAQEVEERLAGRWNRCWLLGWRDVTNAVNERTVIASVLPRAGVNDKFLLMLPSGQPPPLCALLANLDAFGLDYCARQKVGGVSLKYFTMRQLPILPPSAYDHLCAWSPCETLADWITPRVLALTYTAWDMQPFARDLGYAGPPFPWDEEKRFILRCELDAAFFHLYGVEREDVAYIMDTFPIVKRKDEQKFGEYRTRRVILEIYDAMQRAAITGIPFVGLGDELPARDAAGLRPATPA